MNASRLREIADLLLLEEAKRKVQSNLDELNNYLAQLAGNPQAQHLQTQMSDALQRLQKHCAEMRAAFEPAYVKLFAEIGADRYFVDDLPSVIAEAIQQNPMTPAVVHQQVTALVSERQQFLADLALLVEKLERLNIRASDLAPGDAEIGFTLPRSLFDNELDGLIEELRELNSIIRAFAEISTGGAERVGLGQISTSDPLFTLATNPVVIATIAGAVTWALNTWKQVEDIRKARAETRKIKGFKEEEISAFFDKKISEVIELATGEKVEMLSGPAKEQTGRIQEQRNHLRFALRSLMARIERGMTVEGRALPPPFADASPRDAQVAGPTDVVPSSKDEALRALHELKPQMVFPAFSGPPILRLPRSSNDNVQ